MRGHFESQIRRLNRHYQASGGEHPTWVSEWYWFNLLYRIPSFGDNVFGCYGDANLHRTIALGSGQRLRLTFYGGYRWYNVDHYQNDIIGNISFYDSNNSGVVPLYSYEGYGFTRLGFAILYPGESLPTNVFVAGRVRPTYPTAIIDPVSQTAPLTYEDDDIRVTLDFLDSHTIEITTDQPFDPQHYLENGDTVNLNPYFNFYFDDVDSNTMNVILLKVEYYV